MVDVHTNECSWCGAPVRHTGDVAKCYACGAQVAVLYSDVLASIRRDRRAYRNNTQERPERPKES